MRLIEHLHNFARFATGGYVPVTGPLKAAWEVTELCNSRCLTCDRWRVKEEGDVLSHQEGMDLIRQLAAENVVNLSFTGGEPLLRPDIFDLISYAKEMNLTTSLSCSGHSIHTKNAEKICRSGLDLIYISLDGASPEKHDYTRGISGSFRRTMDAIRLLQEKRIDSKPRIFINTTVNSRNVSDLIGIADVCAKKEADGMTIQPIQHFSEAKFNPKQNLLLTSEVNDLMSSNLQVLTKKYSRMLPIMNEYFYNFETFVKNPVMLYKYRCVAAYFSMVIGSKGKVFPCPVEFASLGNLREKSFKDIWYSKEANDLRKKIKNSEHPICWFNCVAPMNILLSYFHPLRFHKLLNPRLLSHIIYKTNG